MTTQQTCIRTIKKYCKTSHGTCMASRGNGNLVGRRSANSCVYYSVNDFSVIQCE